MRVENQNFLESVGISELIIRRLLSHDRFVFSLHFTFDRLPLVELAVLMLTRGTLLDQVVILYRRGKVHNPLSVICFQIFQS